MSGYDEMNKLTNNRQLSAGLTSSLLKTAHLKHRTEKVSTLAVSQRAAQVSASWHYSENMGSPPGWFPWAATYIAMAPNLTETSGAAALKTRIIPMTQAPYPALSALNIFIYGAY